MTDNLHDLKNLEYEKHGNEEMVTATFRNGVKKFANVSGDSGTAMITDIVRQIV